MGFLSPKQAAPVAAVEQAPTRSDPAVEEQRKAVALAEKRRKGRAASILNSPSGVQQAGLINQPELGAGETLGS